MTDEYPKLVEVAKHKSVGPAPDQFGHGPVTIINLAHEDDDPPLWVCLDCGYVTVDNREFAHEWCERDDNPINTTWRELLDDDGIPDQGDGSPAGFEVDE